ncbi:MAG: hypothetical protein IPO82_16645 [Betaproteobacteria bacterium]|nr:hypothetical protein [Betaproteobacteria bacterium]
MAPILLGSVGDTARLAQARAKARPRAGLFSTSDLIQRKLVPPGRSNLVGGVEATVLLFAVMTRSID